MATELTKPQQQSEPLTTWKRLYEAAWERAFNEIMLLMAEQYSIPLMVDAGGKRVPSPVIQFWRESLRSLSPIQMREGLRGYMASERGSFKPNPEEIRANAPQEAIDRPRKVKNPGCPDCNGSGFRWIEIGSKIHPGKKVRAVTDCYCVRIEYNGESYIPEQRQLPSAVDSARAQDLQSKIDAAAKGKSMSPVRSMTDAEYNERQQVLARQAKELKKGKL